MSANQLTTADGRQWFTEVYRSSALSFQIREKCAHEQTAFQSIDIYETEEFGKLMVIDGCVMLTTRDNFLYHEMMSHPVLFTHPDPKDVVIVGGGDCGTLKEVLKHRGVRSVKQVEIDEAVTRLAQQYFPELCEANDDPRAELLFEDAVAWMQRAEDDSADVIIVDSTDPVGPGEGLFNRAFYRNCHRVLRSSGLLIQQSESPLLELSLQQQMSTAMSDVGFGSRQSVLFPQPCYPSGWWSGMMAAKTTQDWHAFRAEAAEQAVNAFQTRYYTPAIHRGALAVPPMMREIFS